MGFKDIYIVILFLCSLISLFVSYRSGKSYRIISAIILITFITELITRKPFFNLNTTIYAVYSVLYTVFILRFIKYSLPSEKFRLVLKYSLIFILAFGLFYLFYFELESAIPIGFIMIGDPLIIGASILYLFDLLKSNETKKLYRVNSFLIIAIVLFYFSLRFPYLAFLNGFARNLKDMDSIIPKIFNWATLLFYMVLTVILVMENRTSYSNES